jgi:uncharacterized protein YndB with AHSA1/START domain
MRRLHMDTMTTDAIKKEIVIKEPVSRVWKALTDPQEFGNWFKVDLSGATFEPGKPAHGKMTYPGYEGMPFEIVVDLIKPPDLFSFRWHPYTPDAGQDYDDEPMTLIQFRLEEVPDGTRLTVTESGFDNIPLARREEAFRSNSEGWEVQLGNIQAYVSRGA